MTDFSHYLDRLRALGACSDAVGWCSVHHPTDLRAAWADCPDGRWMLWLLVRLDRRRGVGVLVEVVRALSAHLAPDEVTIDVLNPLAAWAAGDDTVDVVAVRSRAWDIRGSSYAAYAAAARADDRAAARAARAAAYAAYAAAYATAAYAAYAAADAARQSILIHAANIGERILRELGSPGVAMLDELEAEGLIHPMDVQTFAKRAEGGGA